MAEEHPRPPEGRRGLVLLIAGLSLGFLGTSALFALIAYLLVHH